ncbi:hypothetical protein DSO57_1017929 [Entomophthora muscae]|uniref:Uncharacterized protein n=1 Tax=Entomophthora muscae TaxID=34485 RepID=A0ACC2RVP7_9FUNG|nr:hypothetical protein DSO57_1017929 [Entomophthora muscae]
MSTKTDKFEEVPEIQTPRDCSSLSAYFHIVCVVAGTGTLGLPYAMAQGGWISVVFFFVAAAMSTYTAKLLIECLYYKPGERLVEFPDIGEAAFGLPGRYFTKVFHSSVSLSCGCIYILLTGKNTSTVLDDFSINPMNKTLWILLAGVVITLAFTLLKTMKEVAFLSAFGTIATLVCVVIVVVVGGMEYPQNGLPVNRVFFNLADFPMAVATIAFSYGGNVVYPHVEATMRNPKAWNKTVLLAVLSITAMYVSIACAGYFYYGAGTKSPIMDSLPRKDVLTYIAYVFITLHVAFAAPVYLCSFCLEQERWLKIDRAFMSAPQEFAYRFALRGSLGAILTLIAMYVPYFSSLCGIFGAVSNCIVVFLVPVSCHYKLFGYQKRAIWEHIICVLIIGAGLFGLGFGGHSAFKELLENITEDTN